MAAKAEERPGSQVKSLCLPSRLAYLSFLLIISFAVFTSSRNRENVKVVKLSPNVIDIQALNNKHDYLIISSMSEVDNGDPAFSVFVKDKEYGMLFHRDTYKNSNLCGPVPGVEALYDRASGEVVCALYICGGSCTGLWVLSLNSDGNAETLYEDCNYGHPYLEQKDGIIRIREVWPVFRLIGSEELEQNKELADGLLVERIYTRDNKGIFTLQSTSRAWDDERNLTKEDRDNLENRKQEEILLSK